MAERVFKYHGLGNDFVVMDRRESGRDIDAATAVALCDRRRGIGADGVLVLLPEPGVAARMVVHNADGSVAEMCGNGLRCAVKYLVDRGSGGTRPERLVVATGAGPLACEVRYGPGGGEASEVEVSMGAARLSDAHLPSGPSGGPFVEAPLEGHPALRGTAVSMGNPHLVLLGTPPEEAPRLGPVLEHHPSFPARTNVEFVRVHERSGAVPTVELVVWERGCGITQACGTGACATVAAGVVTRRLPADTWVEVQLPGGPLQVKVRADLSEVRMRGPATHVFDATLPPL